MHEMEDNLSYAQKRTIQVELQKMETTFYFQLEKC